MLKLYTHKAMNFHNTIYTQTFNIGKTHWKGSPSIYSRTILYVENPK